MTSVELEVVQGEDWTVDVLWTDSYDQPQPVEHPCRMVVKDGAGATLITLDTNPSIPDGEVPGIAVSPDFGLLQLHIDSEATAAFPPGQYVYDIFGTVNGDSYAGDQQVFLFGGAFLVRNAVTEF